MKSLMKLMYFQEKNAFKNAKGGQICLALSV